MGQHYFQQCIVKAFLFDNAGDFVSKAIGDYIANHSDGEKFRNNVVVKFQQPIFQTDTKRKNDSFTVGFDTRAKNDENWAYFNVTYSYEIKQNTAGEICIELAYETGSLSH